jgi:hypothetical protein
LISIVRGAPTVIVDDTLLIKSASMIPTLANVVSQSTVNPRGEYPESLLRLWGHSIPDLDAGAGATAHHGHTLVHGTVLGGKTQRVQAVIDAGLPALSIGQIVNRSGLSLSEVVQSLQELKARGKVILLDCPPGSNQLGCQVMRAGGNTLIRQMPR